MIPEEKREHLRKYQRARNRNNPEVRARRQACKRKRYHSDPAFRTKRLANSLNGLLRKKYGIAAEERDAMFVAQGGVCKICGTPPGNRRLDIDHNHQTGVIRGLLCSRCNYALGGFRDSPELLEKAADYLFGST